MNRWTIVFYTTRADQSPVEDFITEAPPQVQARFAQVFELLETYGLQAGEPYVKSIQGVRKMAEVRVRVSSNNYRVFFFTFTGRKMVLLHGFVKKTTKTPAREIRIAQERMLDFLYRQGV